MKRLLMAVVAVALSATLVAGCRWAEEHRETTTGAAIGAAAGGVVGGLAGGRKGAVIGGLLGALAGGGIGAYMEHKDESAEDTKEAQNYNPQQGLRLNLLSVSAEPETVRPGQEVRLSATYALMAPDNTQTYNVTETREVVFNGQKVAETMVQRSRTPGTYTSAVPITLPDTAAPGRYELQVVVSTAGETSRMTSPFTVQ